MVKVWVLSQVPKNKPWSKVPKTHPSRRWSNQCEYRCRLCFDRPFQTLTSGGLRDHIITHHNSTTEEYVAQFQDMMSNRQGLFLNRECANR